MATNVQLNSSAQFSQVLFDMATCWTRNLPTAYAELVATLSTKGDSK